jgi:hypothetical protein
MADNKGCSFSFLPKGVPEALLLQAWQQLDQHHRFGIIPRVCSSWFHLSLPTFTSLKLALRDEGSTQHFAAWLRRHGSTLQHLRVDTTELVKPSDILMSGLLGTISNCQFLSSLHLLRWKGSLSLGGQLLTRLTSLSVRYYVGVPFDLYQQLRRNDMRQLMALDLRGTQLCSMLGKTELHLLIRALPNLTSLDLSHTGIRVEDLASCRSLPPLQELKLSMTDWQSSQGPLAALAVLPCTSLHVSYWGCNAVSRAALTSLAEAAGQLRHLTFSSGTAGVKELALLTGLTELTSLHFTYSGAADADVVTPLAALSNLQQLTVAGLSAVQEEAMRVAVSAGQLRCLKEVTYEVASLSQMRARKEV